MDTVVLLSMAVVVLRLTTEELLMADPPGVDEVGFVGGLALHMVAPLTHHQCTVHPTVSLTFQQQKMLLRIRMELLVVVPFLRLLTANLRKVRVAIAVHMDLRVVGSTAALLIPPDTVAKQWGEVLTSPLVVVAVGLVQEIAKDPLLLEADTYLEEPQLFVVAIPPILMVDIKGTQTHQVIRLQVPIGHRLTAPTKALKTILNERGIVSLSVILGLTVQSINRLRTLVASLFPDNQVTLADTTVAVHLAILLAGSKATLFPQAIIHRNRKPLILVVTQGPKAIQTLVYPKVSAVPVPPVIRQEGRRE